MKTPESIVQHQAQYRDQAWQEYSIYELGMWVHVLSKRATHRSIEARDKARKDIADAKNYHAMIGAMLDEVEAQIG